MRRHVIAAVLGLAALAACARGDADQTPGTQDVSQFVAASHGGAASGPSSIDVQPGAPPVIATNADPCTFFTKAELESAFGVPFGPPKQGRGEPSCRFYNSNTGSVTVRAGEAVSQAERL